MGFLRSLTLDHSQLVFHVFVLFFIPAALQSFSIERDGLPSIPASTGQYYRQCSSVTAPSSAIPGLIACDRLARRTTSHSVTQSDSHCAICFELRTLGPHEPSRERYENQSCSAVSDKCIQRSISDVVLCKSPATRTKEVHAHNT
ncbi:hypothetical protein EV361DRAFT_589403 [Lentinula raphanica]|nr:hypothetical protein EV361DRAFT_589403 [Lentinula raphanica]